MGNRQKVLYLTTKFDHYRVPIFEQIAQQADFDLYVAHTGVCRVTNEQCFKEIIIEEKTVGPFRYNPINLVDFCNQFDIVVASFSTRNISYMYLALSSRRTFKLIYWGIGVRASYKHKFDSKSVTNCLRKFIATKSDAMIFYSEYSRYKYIHKYKIMPAKLFVMPNTVAVSDSFSFDRNKKKNILFIGTLYKQKRIYELLESYFSVYSQSGNLLNKLVIVGDGPEKENIHNWIKDHKLEKNVVLTGQVYDEETKAKIFQSAIACISPGQAGLSVLTSFGYGVPFITHEDSITGGERLNIKHMNNGILMEEFSELTSIINDINTKPNCFIEMGANALEYYRLYCQPIHMVEGFIKAVNFVKL